jgi:phosphatidylserine decarboxylase
MKNYLFYYSWRLSLIPLFMIIFGFYFYFFKIMFLGLFLLFILLNFYRIPDLKPFKRDNDLIYSPAFGQIVDIKKTKDLVTFSIYLNLFDAHIQYYPCDSHILEQRHIDGNHYYTYNLEKSQNNERIVNMLSTKHGVIVITQFAGTITQELISFNKMGENKKQCDELGFIKLGSRVDITIPNKVMKIMVKKGDKVIGGETVLVEYF